MPGQLTISLDLLNATRLSQDGSTAVVQAGSRLGQLYYNVRRAAMRATRCIQPGGCPAASLD